MSENGQAGILIAGIGNRLRRDDGAGPAAADDLALALASQIERGGVEVCEEWGEGARLIDLMRDREAVYLIDAASTGAEAGLLHVFDASSGEIPSDMLCYSTHRFGVAEAVEVARNLGLMPPQLKLYAIEGGDFGHGEVLSGSVARAVDEVCRQIMQQVKADLT